MTIRPMLALAAVAVSTVAMLAPAPASALSCPTGSREVWLYDPLTGRPIGYACVPQRPVLCEEICLTQR